MSDNNNNLTVEQLIARIAELEAQVQAGKKHREPMKVSKSGGITVGAAQVGVFGVTLYYPQWERLCSLLGIEVPASLVTFMEAHKSELRFEKPQGHQSKLLAGLKERVAARKAQA